MSSLLTLQQCLINLDTLIHLEKDEKEKEEYKKIREELKKSIEALEKKNLKEKN